MKKHKKKKVKILIPYTLAVPLTICIAYVLVSLSFLIPYLSNFIKGYYIIEPGDLPNYSDIFNSSFTALNIIISSILSYMVYELYKEQYHSSYNKDIASSSILLYYTLKFNIMRSTSYFLKENIKNLKEEYYTTEDGKIHKNSLNYIQNSQCPSLNYTETLKDHIPPVIGYIDDEVLRTKLFYICEDLNSSYIKTKDIKERLVYVLSEDLVKNRILIEKSSSKWVNVLNNMYNNNWINLNENHRKLMEKLLELSEPKKQ